MHTLREVHLLVLDTLADWEPGYAIAQINRPALPGPPRFRIRTVGFDKTPVRTMGGITILPDTTLSELRPADSGMLILPGSELWTDARTDPALDKARAFVDAGVPVAGICGATFGLARVGLLDDRRHTSNDPGWLAGSGYRGGAHYVKESAVDDRGVITAAVWAGLEFARLILARLEVYPPAALEAWYQLFKTGEAAYYYAFEKALGAGAA
jgi:putative intracellular protease/amidase